MRTLYTANVLVWSAMAMAQTLPEAPSFEVASVRRAPTGERRPTRLSGGPGTSSPGQLTGSNVTLNMLLGRAFDLKRWQLVGGPSLPSDRYDITASIPPGSTREQVNQMIQRLLTERFGLAAHWETRQLPVMELVVAEGGSRLKQVAAAATGPVPTEPLSLSTMARDQDGWPVLPPGRPGVLSFRQGTAERLQARMQTPRILIDFLESRFAMPVADKTGLTGVFDFDLTFEILADGNGGEQAVDAAQPEMLLDLARSPGASLIHAIDSQLGLKLQSRKGPIQVLVIDRVNRLPTEN